MIRISRLADYAMLILSEMASGAPGETLSASALAAKTGLSEATVMKLLKLLCKAELIASKRGQAGGYMLEKSPESLTALAVLEAVEGPLALTHCTHPDEIKLCDYVSQCSPKDGWVRLAADIRVLLERYTLKDFTGNGPCSGALPCKGVSA